MSESKFCGGYYSRKSASNSNSDLSLLSPAKRLDILKALDCFELVPYLFQHPSVSKVNWCGAELEIIFQKTLWVLSFDAPEITCLAVEIKAMNGLEIDKQDWLTFMTIFLEAVIQLKQYPAVIILTSIQPIRDFLKYDAHWEASDIDIDYYYYVDF